MIEIKITCNTADEALKEMQAFSNPNYSLTVEDSTPVIVKSEDDVRVEVSEKTMKDFEEARNPEPEKAEPKEEKPKPKKRSTRKRRTQAEMVADKLLEENRNEDPQKLAVSLLETIRNEGGQKGLLAAKDVITRALDQQGGNYDAAKLKYVDDVQIHAVISEFEAMVKQINEAKANADEEDDDDMFGDD